MASLIPVALYQTGIIENLPDPPSRFFNSEMITRSKAAHPFGVPDALLGLASFSSTFVLILIAGRSTRARKLLAVKLTLDTTAAAFNVARQLSSFRRLCSWCTMAAFGAAVTAYGGRKVIKASFTDAKAFSNRKV